MSTFLMAIRDADGKYTRVEREYVEEFGGRGERFVVHRKFERWAVSHKETGWAVPQSDADTQESAKEQAVAYLKAVPEEKWTAAFELARGMK